MSMRTPAPLLPLAIALALRAGGAPPARPPNPPPPPRPPAAAPAGGAGSADVQPEQDQMQIKLDAALRSYAMLQDENDRLKADAGKDAGPLQARIRILSEQVRRLRDEVADLAAENARLKTRLALESPPARAAKP